MLRRSRNATRIARERRPDLLIDGPLQYDAAAIKDVAQSKAPDSQVAGRATVFIFPDLNTGNTTYKAVQRSADVISIGPMLQGLRKPVNDLSRGALVEDIVFTIALTAIQAEQAVELERGPANRTWANHSRSKTSTRAGGRLPQTILLDTCRKRGSNRARVPRRS
jgi:phosphate acetyltransferase